MDSRIINIKDLPELREIVKRAMPGYRKHKLILTGYRSVEANGGYWDGGSRSSYHLFDLEGRNKGGLETMTAPPQFGGKAPAPYPIKDDEAVFVTGTFRGKPATLTIHSPTLFARFGEQQ